jgi:hypothetical protein
MNLPDSAPTVLIPKFASCPQSAEPCRAAPILLRLLAGGIDVAVEVLLTTLLVALWMGAASPEFPPRYWNEFDYLVDILNTRPDLLLPPVGIFLAVHLVWEGLGSIVLGFSPAGRLLGMRLCTSQGRRPGMFRTGFRAVLALVLTLAAGVSPAFGVLSPRRRMLHDILTGCHVLWGRPPEAWTWRPDLALAQRRASGGSAGPQPSRR